MLDKPTILVVMGVSGCGKTTVGQELARSLNFNFKDGDEFHPVANVEKMRGGIPLTDTDRFPWLQSINQYCIQHTNTVIACSALKRDYRNILRTGMEQIRFIFLKLSRKALESRMLSRRDHFMPVALLDSQLNTLEDPSSEADVVVVNCDGNTTDCIIEEVRAKL